jgi:hypothetical protein
MQGASKGEGCVGCSVMPLIFVYTFCTFPLFSFGCLVEEEEKRSREGEQVLSSSPQHFQLLTGTPFCHWPLALGIADDFVDKSIYYKKMIFLE